MHPSILSSSNCLLCGWIIILSLSPLMLSHMIPLTRKLYFLPISSPEHLYMPLFSMLCLSEQEEGVSRSGVTLILYSWTSLSESCRLRVMVACSSLGERSRRQIKDDAEGGWSVHNSYIIHQSVYTRCYPRNSSD